MKCIYIGVLVFVVAITLLGCNSSYPIANNKSFMAWMDAYIAVEVNTENTITTALYVQGKLPFKLNNIINIQFAGEQDKLEVVKFDITEGNASAKSYQRYDIILKCKANVEGQFEVNSIDIEFSDQPSITYPVGTWYFDVNEAAANVIDSWDSVAAISNNVELPYIYTLINEAAKLSRIQFGLLSSIENENGLPLEGNIDIQNEYSAPIVYIKTKIISTVNQQETIDYGKGTYLLAPLTNQEFVNISQKHNGIK